MPQSKFKVGDEVIMKENLLPTTLIIGAILEGIGGTTIMCASINNLQLDRYFYNENELDFAHKDHFKTNIENLKEILRWMSQKPSLK